MKEKKEKKKAEDEEKGGKRRGEEQEKTARVKEKDTNLFNIYTVPLYVQYNHSYFDPHVLFSLSQLF